MFRNGMTIAIGPENEASTLKSLKLAKIKDFYKMMSFRSTLMGYLVSGHIFDGTLPFSCKKFKKNFWPVQLLENAPCAKKSCTDLLCLVDKLLLLLSLCLFNIKFLTISLQQYNNNIQQEIVQDKRNRGVTPSVAKSRRSKR